MASSFLHILPLFLIFALRAAATPAPAPAPADTDEQPRDTTAKINVSPQELKRLQEVCSHTESAKLCVDTLLTFPESAGADDQMLAALAIRYAANNAAETAFYIGGQAQDVGNSNPKLQQCLTECDQQLEDAVDQLNSCTEFIDNKKAYKDVTDMVDAALIDATSCNEGCEEVASTPEAQALKKKVDHFFDLCSNALVLSKLLK